MSLLDSGVSFETSCDKKDTVEEPSVDIAPENQHHVSTFVIEG